MKQVATIILLFSKFALCKCQSPTCIALEKILPLKIYFSPALTQRAFPALALSQNRGGILSPGSKNATADLPKSWADLPRWSPDCLPFFCRIEHKIGKTMALPLKFRLGSVDYVDWLEGKPAFPTFAPGF